MPAICLVTSASLTAAYCGYVSLYYDRLVPLLSLSAAPHGRLAAAVLAQTIEAHVILLRYEQWLEPFAQAL